MKTGLAVFLACFLLGIATWCGISWLAEWRPAWEEDLYFYVALPLNVIVVAACAWLASRHAWRWVTGIVFGQFLSLVYLHPYETVLLPYAFLMLLVFHIPAFAVAFVVSWSRNTGLIPPPE